jgi:hypothetical protein
MSDIKSFLDDLKQLNEKDCFDVYVPSIDKKISFKALSVKQHKDVVKTVMNGVEGSILVTKIFNDIIEENSLQAVDFKLYDRNKVLVDMRHQSVGSKVTINDVVYTLDDLPEYKFDFDDVKEFNYRGIKVTTQIPTLELDSKITEKSVVEIARLVTDDKKVGSSINILLVYELMKFIQTIQIEDNIINFNDQGTYDKKNIIENLPLKLNNDILEYITAYKEYEQELFTYSDGAKLNIDVSFLASE